MRSCSEQEELKIYQYLGLEGFLRCNKGYEFNAQNSPIYKRTLTGLEMMEVEMLEVEMLVV